jgi:hypothetical protein
MWDQPYLESCCRAALHRLYLAAGDGRPHDQMDGPCLVRLAGMGMCGQSTDGRFALTPDGTQRHAVEVLKRTAIRPPVITRPVVTKPVVTKAARSPPFPRRPA